MFKLYHNKLEKKIEISKVKDKEWFFLEKQCKENDIVKYNNCFFLSNNRKELNKLAEEIKQNWIEEYKRLLEQYQNMEIKRKYG